jgi:hypothetical protein
MMLNVEIQDRRYVLYPNGLLIAGAFEGLKVVRPSANMFNRLVTVNERVRALLGMNPEHIQRA